jgi:hypothetical protein
MVDQLAHIDWTRVVAIGLDHDLELLPGSDGKWVDPGTGRDVADCLARMEAGCPIVIHSTNAPAATGMQLVLEASGWDVQRVVPYGDLEWISERWLRALRDAIVGGVSEEEAVSPR